jgi:hypothetical protein
MMRDTRTTSNFISKLKRVVLSAFLILLASSFAASPIAALSAEQNAVHDAGIKYLDIVDELACEASAPDESGGDVDGSVESDNVRTAYEFFAARVAPFRAAAIVGNLQVESPGLNPRTNQGGGGPGRGIAQWSVDGRWVELQKWAAKNGDLDIYDINTQLGFIWHEMNNVPPWNKSLPAINRETNMTRVEGDDSQGATQAFMLTYEKPDVPHLVNRENAAKAVLRLYGNGAPANGEAVETNPDTGNPSPTTGAACSEGNFSGNPDQTKKLGRGFTLNENTDYSATPCAAGSTEGEIYTHPTAHFKIRICIVNGTGIDVASIVSARVVAMVNDAKSAGVTLNGGGFRTYEEQLRLRSINGCNVPPGPSNSGCSPATAPPGKSQHERGLAIDFSGGGGAIGSGSSQFNWLKSNAVKYGYYNLAIEPWHWSTSGN